MRILLLTKLLRILMGNLLWNVLGELRVTRHLLRVLLRNVRTKIHQLQMWLALYLNWVLWHLRCKLVQQRRLNVWDQSQLRLQARDRHAMHGMRLLLLLWLVRRIKVMGHVVMVLISRWVHLLLSERRVKGIVLLAHDLLVRTLLWRRHHRSQLLALWLVQGSWKSPQKLRRVLSRVVGTASS